MTAGTVVGTQGNTRGCGEGGCIEEGEGGCIEEGEGGCIEEGVGGCIEEGEGGELGWGEEGGMGRLLRLKTSSGTRIPSDTCSLCIIMWTSHCKHASVSVRSVCTSCACCFKMTIVYLL